MLGLIRLLLGKKLVIREIGSLSFFRNRVRFMGMRSGKMRRLEFWRYSRAGKFR